MFKLDTSTDYLWPCTIQIPVADGRYKDVKFRVRFARIPRNEIQELTEDDDAFLERVVIGWDGFKDHAGEPIEYTEENRTQLLNMTEARIALVRAYFESVQGKEGRRGNSRR